MTMRNSKGAVGSTTPKSALEERVRSTRFKLFPRKTNTRIWSALILLGFLASLAFLAPILKPFVEPLSPCHVNLHVVNLPPGTQDLLLGSDNLGRDVLAMALWGARTSLLVGFASAFIAVSVGCLWGSVSALCGGLVDQVMMRIVDGLLAIPSLILLLALSALVNRPEFTTSLPEWFTGPLGMTETSLGLLPLATVVAVISATSWLEAARISHAKVAEVRLQEYIEAARALGTNAIDMLRRHLLPNAIRIIMIQATLLVSDAIVMEAGLSFLGLGLGPGTPSWGTMLQQAQTDLFCGNWWAPAVPAILISLAVLSVNLLGEGLLQVMGYEERLS